MKVIFKTVVLSAFWLASLPLLAQPGDPGGDPDVPISGLGWLIAMAVALGIKFIKRPKN